MRIVSAASADPKNYYPQKVLIEAFRRYWGDQLEQPRKLRWLHERVGVDGRYLAYPIETYENLRGFGEANNLWLAAAEELGQRAFCRALSRAGLAREDVGALLFVSITGIASPAIDARLVNTMGLPLNIRRMPIFGLGCVSGAAGIARAADYMRAYPDQVAVLLAVELCSLTIQRDDLSVPNLISSGLFGDGAVAVVVAGAEREIPGPQIVDTRSVFYPDTEGVMGWDISEKGFRIVLSPGVPDMVRHLAHDVDCFLRGHDLARKDIGHWIIPYWWAEGSGSGGGNADAAGGRTECFLGVSAEDGESFVRGGAGGSGKFMTERRPEPGGWSVLAAMGPGFCSELVLLRW